MPREVRRRGDDGRFVADADLRTRLAQTADVLNAADPDHPERVSTRQFDDARSRAGHPSLGRARNLADWLGMSWPEFRHLALAPARDPVRTYSARHRAAPAPWRDRDGAVLAMRRVAEALRQDQLAATAYDQYRDGVSASTRKLLPTSAQIVGLFKTWEGALEAAELAPVATPQPFGLPIVEAIGLFVRTQGWLPSRGELERFAADKRWTFPIQSTSRKPWRAWIADFESWWIGDVGQQMPDRSPFRSEFIPLTETEINALPTTARVRKGHWTRDRVIDCVIAYLTDNPSVKSLQQRPYRAWANQRNASGTATASTRTLTRYGTLRELELAARRAIDTTP